MISLALHPMMVAPVTFAILIYTEPAGNNNLHLTFFIAFFFSTVLSITTVVYLKSQEKISDLDASRREERIQPLVLGTIYCAAGFVPLMIIDATPIVQGLMFCYAVNTFLVWFITKRWKISIHAIGIGGPMTALWLFGIQLPIIMTLAVIAVCTARVILKRHTIAQVLAGIMISMVFTYLQLQYLFL